MSALKIKHLAAPLFAATLLALGSGAALAESLPAHVQWADEIVQNVSPENNTYDSKPSYVYWAGINGATEYVNRTVCATFVTQVLMQSYGWSSADFLAAFGSSSPNATRYHDAIESGSLFQQITAVEQILPGDIIAIRYPEGSSVSGHVMIAMSQPRVRTATAPFVNGSTQYEVDVADSSSSGHGPGDTRRMEDGTWDQGAGQGTMRIYALPDGSITGYTWSTYSSSVYYEPEERHLVIGRL